MTRPGTTVINDALMVSVSEVEVASMPDTCTITRGATRVLNTSTDTWSVVGGTTVYTGMCRAESASTRGMRARGIEFGELAVADASPLVSIPLGSAVVERLDMVTITTSHDPRFVERSLTVDEVTDSTTATAIRLFCSFVEA